MGWEQRMWATRTTLSMENLETVMEVTKSYLFFNQHLSAILKNVIDKVNIPAP